MGQAKARGSREERIAQSIQRRREEAQIAEVKRAEERRLEAEARAAENERRRELQLKSGERVVVVSRNRLLGAAMTLALIAGVGASAVPPVPESAKPWDEQPRGKRRKDWSA